MPSESFPWKRYRTAERYLYAVKPHWMRFGSRMNVVPINVPAPPGEKYGGMTSTDEKYNLFVDEAFARNAPIEEIAGAIEHELRYHAQRYFERMRYADKDRASQFKKMAFDLEVNDTIQDEMANVSMFRIRSVANMSTLFTTREMDALGIKSPPSIARMAWTPSRLGMEPGKTAEEYLADFRRAMDQRDDDSGDSEGEHSNEDSQEEESEEDVSSIEDEQVEDELSNDDATDDEGNDDLDSSEDGQSSEGTDDQDDEADPEESESEGDQDSDDEGDQEGSEPGQDDVDEETDSDSSTSPSSSLTGESVEGESEEDGAEGEGEPGVNDEGESAEDPPDVPEGGVYDDIDMTNTDEDPIDKMKDIIADVPSMSWWGRDGVGPQFTDEDADPSQERPDEWEEERWMQELAEDVRESAKRPMFGIDPGNSIMRMTDDILKRMPNSHHELLRRAISSSVHTSETKGASDTSMAVRNPNQPMIGPILMGLLTYAPAMSCIIDVSGSMKRHMERSLVTFRDIVRSAAGIYGDRINWMAVDSAVVNMGSASNVTMDTVHQISMGFGGTVLKNTMMDLAHGTFKWEGKRLPRQDVVIVLTDCQFRWPWREEGEKPPSKTKFIIVAPPGLTESSSIPGWAHNRPHVIAEMP